ncbi:MAG: hypothetical protein Kow0088_15160 [Anaerolineales bacterium]
MKAVEMLTIDGKSITIKELFRMPLMIPVLALIFTYLISTILSVAPHISLWGSYQRLQGTFTTYSYLVLFLSMVFNRPTGEQIRRLVTMMIAVSLPVAVYGLLQRYKIDPIPWGGDVSTRIASTLGNSIFVAAYLIMVFPLTLGRIVESFRRMLESIDFDLKDFFLSTCYVFTALLQVIALYFSGSRGPALGWIASLFFFVLCLTYLARKRTYGLVILGFSILTLLFLIIFNLPQSPFERLKQHPSIGRFGQLLDPQSNNARVRTYIWQGAVKLYGFHSPLEYPDGRQDVFNWLRPIIGYGPETMYVAYNRFYVPELTQVERRNASPDRSHNETWDALIITGAFGFVIYIGLFLSLFYYGYRKLDLIQTDREKKIYWGVTILLGVLFSVVLILWRGAAYFGIAFPIGMLAGFFGYLAMKILFLRADYREKPTTTPETILLLSILATLVAHLVEINFGIAIVATRTYFWSLAAIIVLLVTNNSKDETYQEEPATIQSRREGNKRRKRGGVSEPRRVSQNAIHHLGSDVGLAILVALILIVLGYNFMNATELGSSALQIIWKSFTEVKKEAAYQSNGILIVISLAWVVSTLLLTGEETDENNRQDFANRWLRVMGLSLGLAFVYWLIHASLLASIVATQIGGVGDILARIRQYEGLLVGFYIFVAVLMIIYAMLSAIDVGGALRLRNNKSAVIGLICLILSLILIYQRNIRVIQADIAFKLAEPFSKSGSWQVSTQIYQHAIELAPREDYYYLFLGRAYLENAREINDASQREALFSRAKTDLTLAQSLNPLNTDHTANLARLYSQWAVNTTDETLRQERFQTSDKYFAQAVSLSPNNSRLWGEWAVLLMSNEKTHDQALPKLMTAYQLDPNYDWLAYLFGEYYRLQASRMEEGEERQKAIELAVSNYQKAASLTEDNISKKTYFLMAAQMAIEGNLNSQAIDALEQVLTLSPNEIDSWKYEQTLAQLYLNAGQKELALLHAQNALKLSPPDQQQELENLLQQITQSSK